MVKTVISRKNWESESERLKAVSGFTSLPVYKENRADEKSYIYTF